MNFFSKLFGSRNPKRPLPETNKVPQAAATGPDYKFYESLATVLVSNNELRSALLQQLKKAMDTPEAFFDTDGEFILSDRGLTYPKALPLVPKFVLVDTLMEHDLMAEVDWKSAEDEVRFSINQILKAKGYDFSIAEEDGYEGKDTYETIAQINDNELQAAGYSLEILDIDSDSYVFTIVPATQQASVAALFDRLK